MRSVASVTLSGRSRVTRVVPLVVDVATVSSGSRVAVA